MNITLPKETIERVEAARHSYNNESRPDFTSKQTEEDFKYYIFMLGLLDYEYRIQPKITGKPYKAYKAKGKMNLTDRGI